MKNGKRILKVMFSFPRKSKFLWHPNLLTLLIGKETFTVKKQETDKEGRYLILDVSVNNSQYILVNSYNANTEKERINVFSNMFALSKKFDINPKNR